MQIYFITRGKRPHTGDLRTTKKHGLQVRVPDRVQHGPDKGAFIVSRGRQLYSWVSVAEAIRLGYGHHIPDEHKPKAKTEPLGYMQQRGAT